MEKDYLLQMRVKNAHLMRIMRKCGFETAASLSRATGVSPTLIGDFLNLKRTPYNKFTNEWLPSVVKISECLNAMPSQLFPRHLLTIPRDKGITEFEVDMDELLTIEQNPKTMEQKVIEDQTNKTLFDFIDKLNPREKKVIKLRYGIQCNEHTLRQCGDKIGVQKERIRQIEFRAISKLKGYFHRYKQQQKLEILEAQEREDVFKKSRY